MIKSDYCVKRRKILIRITHALTILHQKYQISSLSEEKLYLKKIISKYFEEYRKYSDPIFNPDIDYNGIETQHLNVYYENIL